MRAIALMAALCVATACSKGSSSTTFVSAPAAQPSPIGSWAGEYRRGDDSWPLTGSIERDPAAPNSEQLVGELSAPGDVTHRVFSGRGTEAVEGQTFVVEILATLVDEPEDVRDALGYLYVGAFESESHGTGSIRFRVVPLD